MLLRMYAGIMLVASMVAFVGCGSPASNVDSATATTASSRAMAKTEDMAVEAQELEPAHRMMPAEGAAGGESVAASPVAPQDGTDFEQIPKSVQNATRKPSRDEGRGAGMGGDKYGLIVENSFVPVSESPLSTFSIDVDTASYSKTRMYLLQQNALPPADAVRIEELVNYFDYDYSPPVGEHPFSVHVELAESPWKPGHRLARVGLKGKEIEHQRPSSNLVFLLDVSGSMDYPNKLPLLKKGLRMLTSQLGENDRVAIVVYAGAAGLVLPPTRGDDRKRILAAFDQLRAGGSTNGGEGIRLAYQTAQQNFIPGGVNRVILCTDGDFNVGTTSTGELVRLAEQNAQGGIFVSVLGFGMGNHNDAMLEELSNKANGNYAFIDNENEARKVLLEQAESTLVTIAKDVKIQIEFNPQHVAAYRLIGYENRHLEAHEFNDDKKDAGEIGAGHTVTALYELIPHGEASDSETPSIDPLKYQKTKPTGDGSDELMTVKLRYKEPDATKSKLIVAVVKNNPTRFGEATRDFQFATAVAAFGMLLRNSEHRGDATFASVLEIAQAARGEDRHGYRGEFLSIVSSAGRLAGEDVPEISWTPPADSDFDTGYSSTPVFFPMPTGLSPVDRLLIVVVGCLSAFALICVAGIGLLLFWRRIARTKQVDPGAQTKPLPAKQPQVVLAKPPIRGTSVRA
jgi:Ca-activated chloride channel family protein